MKMPKVRITPEAANDIWQACLKKVANGHCDSPFPVETLADNLRDIQSLVNESSDDVVGLFLGQRSCQREHESDQEDGVTTSKPAEITRDLFGLITSKVFRRQLEARILEEIIDSLRSESLREGQFDRSALDQGNDDLHRIIVLKGKLF